MRQEKPYCENPDSDNRNVVDLGLESWSNALRRDWSFIHFLFSGQLKSTLNCQACSKESITFDTFTSIPLSLPEPSKLLINVFVYRLPRRLKDLISGKPASKLDSSLRFLPSPGGKEEDLNTEHSGGEFQGAINHMMSGQPIRISLRVDKEVKIKHIVAQICAIPDVGIDVASKSSTLCLYAQANGIIRGIFNPEQPLNSYQVATNEIEAFELVTRSARDALRLLYQQD